MSESKTNWEEVWEKLQKKTESHRWSAPFKEDDWWVIHLALENDEDPHDLKRWFEQMAEETGKLLKDDLKCTCETCNPRESSPEVKEAIKRFNEACDKDDMQRKGRKSPPRK